MKRFNNKDIVKGRDLNRLVDDIKRLCRITSTTAGTVIHQSDNGTSINMKAGGGAGTPLLEWACLLGQPETTGWTASAITIDQNTWLPTGSAFTMNLFADTSIVPSVSAYANTYGISAAGFDLLTVSGATSTTVDASTIVRYEKARKKGDDFFVCVQPVNLCGEAEA